MSVRLFFELYGAGSGVSLASTIMVTAYCDARDGMRTPTWADWDSQAPLGVTLFWPIALPACLLGMLAANAAKRANRRDRIAEEERAEKQRWISTPVEKLLQETRDRP